MGAAAMLFAAMWAANPANAQPGRTPTKPIRLVVPYAPGGGTDVLARLVVTHWYQPIVVENRRGPNGVIGANVTHASPQDGYTLLFAAADSISVAPYIHKKVVQFQPNGFRPRCSRSQDGLRSGESSGCRDQDCPGHRREGKNQLTFL